MMRRLDGETQFLSNGKSCSAIASMAGSAQSPICYRTRCYHDGQSCEIGLETRRRTDGEARFLPNRKDCSDIIEVVGLTALQYAIGDSAILLNDRTLFL